MKKLLPLLLLFIFQNTTAQKKLEVITIGSADSVYSNVLKEQRNYWVYLPASYTPGDKNKKFPVLYLLDGDGHFHSVTGLIHQLAGGINGNSVFPEMIVVAILNTDRTRDLTPVKGTNMPPQMAEFLKTAGGGENFISFMKSELMPAIEKKYNTAPYRMLVGHSFGGLLAMHILQNHTELFNSYIAIDPSMWWSGWSLLKQIEKELPTKNYNNRTLYLSIANTLTPGMKESEVDKDTTSPTEHIRSIRRLAQVLDKAKPKGLQYACKYYDGDDHGSVPLISEYDGLRYVFADYRINAEVAFNNLDSLVRHYQMLTRKMGYTLLPAESLINQIGYMQLGSGEVDKAIAAFELNVKNYPASANVYDSLADAYAQKGDTAKAKSLYQKTLSIDPAWPGTKEKLEMIK